MVPDPSPLTFPSQPGHRPKTLKTARRNPSGGISGPDGSHRSTRMAKTPTIISRRRKLLMRPCGAGDRHQRKKVQGEKGVRGKRWGKKVGEKGGKKVSAFSARPFALPDA